jgi:hypothetical protein
MGDRTPEEPDLEPIDLTGPTPPLDDPSPGPGQPDKQRRSARHGSQPRLLIPILGVAVASASAAVVATLALSHRTFHTHSASHASTTLPVSTTTGSGTAVTPYATRFDGWTVTPEQDPPTPGRVPGSPRFSLIDRYRGRPAGIGKKWLVVNVTITNNQTTPRPFAADMVELNASKLQLYAVDATTLAQYRTPVEANHSIRRALVFRVPDSINGMFLVFRPDWMGALNRGQAGELDLNCC